MDITTPLLIIGFAALIHASFQLSVSVLTLLSGHAIGAKRSHARLLHLTTSYIAGTKVMSLLLVSFAALIIQSLYGAKPPEMIWTLACSLLFVIGVAVWLFYYRRQRGGTSLWIPRAYAQHLEERSKATKSGPEAFSLGLTSVISELLFIVGPLLIAGLVLVTLPGIWQLVGIAIYTIVSTFPSLIVWGLIGSGHSLSRIQKWRETNKRFLQFVAGSGLLILGFYVYVNEVLGTAVGGL